MKMFSLYKPPGEIKNRSSNTLIFTDEENREIGTCP